MQKKPKPTKLILAMETLRNLNGSDLGEAAGGYNYSTGAVCHYSNGQVTNCTVCPGCTL